MKKSIFLTLIFLTFLNGANAQNVKCPEKITTLFENSYEKIFEFKDKIYKIVKGSNRRDSILMILDENLKRYITISNENDTNQDNDDDTLELMR